MNADRLHSLIKRPIFFQDLSKPEIIPNHHQQYGLSESKKDQTTKIKDQKENKKQRLLRILRINKAKKANLLILV